MHKQSLLRNLIGYSLPSYVGAAFSLLSIPIITRLFSADEVGKINMFLAYANILFVFCNMGYDQAFVRFCNERENNNTIGALSGLCMSISFIFLLIVAVVTFLFYKHISFAICDVVSIWVVVALDLFLAVRIITQYTTLISRMSQNIIEYSAQTILTIIMTKFVFIIAAVWNPVFHTAIKIIVISNIILAAIFCMYFIYKGVLCRFRGLTKAFVVQLSKYALPFVPTFFIATANLYLSQFILKKYVGFDAIGIYANAVSMANIMSIVQSGFNAYWPAFVFANYKTEQSTIQKLHYLVIIVLTLFSISVVAGQDVLYLIVGDEFKASKSIFPLLIIVPIVYTMAETTRIGIRIAQKTYYELFISTAVLASNFVLCLVLIPRYYLVGAAMSSVISSIIGLYIASYIANKYYQSISSFIPMTLSIILLFISAYINFIDLGSYKYICYISLCVLACLIYYKQVVAIIKMICSYCKCDK